MTMGMVAVACLAARVVAYRRSRSHRPGGGTARRRRGEPLGLPFPVAIFEGDVAALEISEVAQPDAERIHTGVSSMMPMRRFSEAAVAHARKADAVPPRCRLWRRRTRAAGARRAPSSRSTWLSSAPFRSPPVGAAERRRGTSKPSGRRAAMMRTPSLHTHVARPTQFRIHLDRALPSLPYSQCVPSFSRTLESKLRQYVRLVAGGGTVLVTDRDRVVADWCPHPGPQPPCVGRDAGGCRASGWIARTARDRREAFRHAADHDLPSLHGGAAARPKRPMIISTPGLKKKKFFFFFFFFFFKKKKKKNLWLVLSVPSVGGRLPFGAGLGRLHYRFRSLGCLRR